MHRFLCHEFLGNAKIVETLVTNGAKVDDGFETTGWTPLMYAAEKGNKMNHFKRFSSQKFFS